MAYYSMLKQNFEFESYLSNIKNDTLRKTLTRFRISSHSLAMVEFRAFTEMKDFVYVVTKI